MAFVSAVIDLLTEPQGGFIYHLLILLIIQAALGMALTEWRRSHRRGALRILIAFGSLLLMRAILAGMEVLKQLGALPSPTTLIIVPPLEGLFTIVGTGFLCWAFLVPPSTKSRVPDVLLTVNSSAGLLAYAVLVPLWYIDLQANPSLYPYYTLHWQDSLWGAWQAVLLLLACVLCLVRKIEQRELLFAAFGALLVGNLLHLMLVYPQEPPHIPVWTRLGEIVAFPLLVVVVYRIVNKERPSVTEELDVASVSSLRQTQELSLLIQTSRTVSDSLDLDTILENVAKSVVLALDADHCVIILKDEAGKDKMQLVASHDAHDAKAKLKGKVRFFLQEQPLIKRAVDRKSQFLLRDTRGDPAAKALHTILGLSDGGPLMIQPLFLQDELLGVIVLANNRTKAVFSAAQGSICQTLAAQMALAIRNGQRYQALSNEVARLNRSLRGEQADALRTKQFILENVVDGIIVSNENDKVVTANSAAQRILGMDSESLIGKDVRDILGGLSWQREADLEAGGSASVVKIDEGSEIPPLQTVSTIGGKKVRANMVPVMVDGDKFWGIVTTLRDITEESRTEETKTRLITNISEELRTPLTSIKSYSDILLAEVAGMLTRAQGEYLQKIQTNVERMQEMLDNLYEVTAVDTTRVRIQARPFDVEKIMYQAVNQTRQEMIAKQLKLSFDLPDELPVGHGDPASVQQILVNLLHNAFDLSPAGGNVDIRVTIEPGTEWQTPGTKRPRYLVISISDEGPNITSQRQQRILASNAEERKPPAPGSAEIDLRLAVVKSLVEAQAGRFWAESAGDTGNTFSFILPLAEERKEG